jgi:flavin reductase (DIM6/NTAB) family NADH-FMN oxidoreductase RutF
MVTGSPILDGASASFDCEVQERIPAASHHIFIGRVVAVASTEQNTLPYRDGLFRKLASSD